MKWVLLIALIFGAAIYYVQKLDFEIGTGFSEEKRKAREAKYKIKKREKETKKIGPGDGQTR